MSSKRRTIPTRVGKTQGYLGKDRPATDHPHASGENAIRFALSEVVCGPSPREWGKLRFPRTVFTSKRTIPTRVGKTYTSASTSTPITDHPHASGENYRFANVSALANGPSPREWGKLRRPGRHRTGLRTIPTRVGKTVDATALCAVNSDHPHASGENLFGR